MKAFEKYSSQYTLRKKALGEGIPVAECCRCQTRPRPLTNNSHKPMRLFVYNLTRQHVGVEAAYCNSKG